jgi:hypothetical protein
MIVVSHARAGFAAHHAWSCRTCPGKDGLLLSVFGARERCTSPPWRSRRTRGAVIRRAAIGERGGPGEARPPGRHPFLVRPMTCGLFQLPATANSTESREGLLRGITAGEIHRIDNDNEGISFFPALEGSLLHKGVLLGFL